MNGPESWDIVDRDTEERATSVSFLSREGAERQIGEWKERCRRGGRPDVTLETLQRLEPRRVR